MGSLIGLEMPYLVYLVSYTGAPRLHQGVFVETEEDRSGYIFHVTGDIQNGMKMSHKRAKDPERPVSFNSKSYIDTSRLLACPVRRRNGSASGDTV